MRLVTPSRRDPARELPVPDLPRFVPLRAGILNVWQYDDQEFWFHGGRLILRGGNEAGKTKALEVLLPFLFDGSVAASRLDPFGGGSKTMHWNLVGFDPDRKLATGYTWIEFGRLDEGGRPAFVTLVAGLRAKRDRRDVTTWFAVLHGRIGVDVDLAPARKLLTRDQLAEAIGPAGTVFETARDYRDAVDRELFGLGRERYEALVHLLLRLRRPQLSAKLDPDELSSVLTNSLPPLDPARVEAVSRSFDHLEEQAEELAGLERAHDALCAFRDVYRRYAGQQTRLRSAAVRSAVSRFDKVTRDVRRAEADLARLATRLDVCTARRVGLTRVLDELDASIRTLEGAPELRDARRLDDLRETADVQAQRARERSGEAERASVAERAARGEYSRREVVAEAAAADAARAVAASDGAAAAADLALEHAGVIEAARGGDDSAPAILRGLLHRREEVVSAVREVDAAVTRARAEVRRAEENREQSGARLESALESARAETAAHGECVAEFLGATVLWAEGLPTGTLGADAVDRTAERALHLVERDESTRTLAAGLLAPALGACRGEQNARVADVERLTRERSSVEDEIAALATGGEPAPPRRSGRPHDSASRVGPALWSVVDFRDAVTAPERAALEAALDASGLLDAAVADAGALISPDTDDTLLRGATGGGGRTLADVLVASGVDLDDAAVDVAAVRAALAAVELVDARDDATTQHWIALDGRWCLGPLEGRASKESAEYVGAAAREARRRRLLADAEQRRADLNARLEIVTAEVAVWREREARLVECERSIPTGNAVQIAIALCAKADEFAAAAACEHEQAGRAVDRSVSARDAARDALRRVAEQHGVVGWIDRLDELEAETSEYRRQTEHALSALRGAALARQEWDAARVCAEEAGQEARRRRAEADEAARQASRKRADLDALEEAVGPRAREAVASLAARRERRMKVLRVRDRVDRRRESDVERRGAVRQSLDDATRRRAEREAVRSQCVQALERLATTELLRLALGDDAPVSDVPWTLTAALDVARRAEAATQHVAIDAAAVDRVQNETDRALGELRTGLTGDFDPTLDNDDGLRLVTLVHAGRSESVTDLVAKLASEVEERRRLLRDEERELMLEHLTGDLGGHLQERIQAARSLVQRINEQLSLHHLNSGESVKLLWRAAPSQSDEAARALTLLRTDVRLLADVDRERLGAFLRERAHEARHEDGAGTTAERLARALDYRDWHRFSVQLRAPDGTARILTKKLFATGSGGSKAVLVHLPLFAAAAAHYASGSSHAPRLVLLDEAFAGIDRGQRGRCMALLVAFDLDCLLTSYDEWGCYAEVPGVAIYDLARDPNSMGVAAMRFVWDGNVRAAAEPPPAPVVAAQAPPVGGLFDDA